MFWTCRRIDQYGPKRVENERHFKVGQTFFKRKEKVVLRGCNDID